GRYPRPDRGWHDHRIQPDRRCFSVGSEMSNGSELLRDKERLIRLKKRELALLDGRESLLRYCELQLPDPSDPENPDLSRFEATPQAIVLCQIMEKVERGELKRVAVSIGPQLGKSEIISRRFPAWC